MDNYWNSVLGSLYICYCYSWPTGLRRYDKGPRFQETDFSGLPSGDYPITQILKSGDSLLVEVQRDVKEAAEEI